MQGPRIAMAVRVERAPRLDGTLQDRLWQTATPITDFRQREPAEGEPPTESTPVRILYTRRGPRIFHQRSSRCIGKTKINFRREKRDVRSMLEVRPVQLGCDHGGNWRQEEQQWAMLRRSFRRGICSYCYAQASTDGLALVDVPSASADR